MRGLTHRDLKPTNVLISTQGSAKLVDFGLAEIAAPLPGEDHDLTVDRTVDYAGLEKATAVKHGDPRSDIYFIGTIFYEMLCGHPALSQTRDKVARMNRHRFDSVAPLESWGIELPGPVQHLMRKMLSFDPAGRYQTPAQLHEAVRKVQCELDGVVSHKTAPAGPKSLFVVEANEKLKEVFRTKFAQEKFRVLMSAEPGRALHRYEEQPYHAIIVDAGTAGEPGVRVFKKVFEEADEIDLSLAGVLILNEEQSDWADQVPKRPDACVMVRPIIFKQLADKLHEVLDHAGDEPSAG
jgi:serine/threonine protein kinase